jgi:hypothetical protein
MNNKISVFGSSSARSFESLFPNTFVFPTSTAKGLNNPNSQSKVNKNIYCKIKSLQKSSNVIFFFGAVDLNFVTNYKYNLIDKFNCEKYIIKSANHYINFIKKNTNHLNIFICEVPISHVIDKNLIKILKFYENQREDIWIESKLTKVILHEIRNKHILLFNKELEKLCDINDFKLLKINKYFKNSAGDFKIPSKYIRKDELDHHLKNNISELYLKSLNDLFFKV